MQPSQMCRKLTVHAIATVVLVVAGGVAPDVATANSLDRFTVIAGGWQLERRCQHLDGGARDTFGQIAAHAEVDMAGKHGAGNVKQVLAGAEQFGQEKGANCSDETRQAVNRSYGVARQYAQEQTAIVKQRTAAAKRKAERKAQRKREQRKAQRKRAQQRKAAQVRTAAKARTRRVAVRPDPTLSADTRSSLQRFGVQTRAYYLQRRCGHLRYEQDLAFWKLIAHQHHALIRKFGAGAVGRVERQAKAGAYSGSLRCGGRTRRMVRSGHEAIQRDVTRN